MASIDQTQQRIRRADDAGIREGARLLKDGRLVAFPTETVYGLGADARNAEAVAGIFAAKQRPRINPLIIHLADQASAKFHGVFNDAAAMLADHFWPGPLTLVVPRTKSSDIAAIAGAGLETLAVRVPAHQTAQALLARSGLAVAAPSANLSGRISATQAIHVAEDLGTNVDLVLDAGATALGIESTIVDCTGEQARLLRPGAVTRGDIEHVLGHEVATGVINTLHPSAPGQLASHYAPRAQLRLNATHVEPGEALLAFGAPPPGGDVIMRNLSPSGDLIEAAANLFDHLRALDALSNRIAVMPIPDDGLGEAINDRLIRAAAPRPELSREI